MLIYGQLYGILGQTINTITPQLIKKRPLDCILKIVNLRNKKGAPRSGQLCFLSRPDSYSPSNLRLTKNLPNIVLLVDKIDKYKHIGHMQVPLLLRLWLFTLIDIKLRNYNSYLIIVI